MWIGPSTTVTTWASFAQIDVAVVRSKLEEIIKNTAESKRRIFLINLTLISAVKVCRALMHDIRNN